MAQSSSAERIVDVVEFLGSNPDRDFTLSELCRKLELSKATAHALLATLTERAWVVRHPRDKTYRLGPALTTIAGAAGARQLEVVDYARDEMQELAKDLNVQCVASAVLGDDIVLLAVIGSARPLSVHVQAGQRIPLAPPLGTVFMAWAGPTRIDRWLRKLGPNATEAQLAGYQAAVDRVRQRGYSLSLEVDHAGAVGAGHCRRRPTAVGGAGGARSTGVPVGGPPAPSILPVEHAGGTGLRGRCLGATCSVPVRPAAHGDGRGGAQAGRTAGAGHDCGH